MNLTHIYRCILMIILFISFLFPSLGNRKNNIISGVIIDAQSKQSIPYAEVFISGTTVGSISDKEGKYILEVPFLPCTFVADHVAYESYITVLHQCNNQQNISLIPSNISILEVKVESKNKRNRNLRFFYKHFH